MNDILRLVPSLGAGVVLGTFFFGGLWWTVSKGMTSERPAVWFLGSLVIRTGVALAGFYWVAHGDWKRVLACLAGFVAARLAVTRFARRPAETGDHPNLETGDAH